MTRASGQIRASQVITTWGPGALIDLPLDAGIVGGLDTWPPVGSLREIVDARLTGKLAELTGVAGVRLYEPPPDESAPGARPRGVGVWRFPQWVVVQEEERPAGERGGRADRSRRLVKRTALDPNRTFERRQVVPTRFVRACPRGHIDDIDWYRFVHREEDEQRCRRPLWLDERGTGGDLADLIVRCECGKSRGLHEAAELADNPLGSCRGARPWLGAAAVEPCGLPSRLLIRTAANAYFPQVMSALFVPRAGVAVQEAVRALWADLQIVDDAAALAFIKRKPQVAAGLAGYADDEVLDAIEKEKAGEGPERSVKEVELDALLAAPEGYADDVPIDLDFHARRLPHSAWRRSSLSDPIARVIALHRLREVLALVGFTRFEAVTPDIDGDLDSDVERAALALDPSWFPAVENHGEGVFVVLDPAAVADWLARDAVRARLDALREGHKRWAERRKSGRGFPGGPYVLLHTLSHLLMQSLAMRCGYPASSLRERIYADYANGRFGLLLYTASPDAEGTLGGLVAQARHIESHLAGALRAGGLCSNDPICAQHSPGEGMEGRWLHGAACHGCALVAETACEMRNDHLDRALVVPTLADPLAAFWVGVT